MSYTINPNAKNKWARNADNTMDLSLETDASSVYLDNGRTLEQEIGEGSMVSNVATVDTSMSKVIDGTLDGAYESLVFKGKSLVNIVNYSNGDITSGNSVDLTTGTITLKGRNGWSNAFLKYQQMKPSTKYLCWVNILQVTGTVDYLQVISSSNQASAFTNAWRVESPSVGFYKNIMTSETDLTDRKYVFRSYVGSGSNGATIQYQVGCVEYQEGMENWDIPCFTGIGSVKMPILRNVGKNLFNINQPYDHAFTPPQKYFIENNKLHFIGAKNHENLCWLIKVSKGERVYCSCLEENNKGKIDVRFFSEKRVSNNFTNRNSWDCNGTIKSTICSDEWMLLMLNTSTDSGDFVFTNIIVSYYDTSYEDHKTNILHTSEEIVLREVGGVCDTYNPLTGEYVQRIGELTFDGSSDEAWVKDNDKKINTYVVRISLPNSRGKGGGNGIANIISVEYVSRDVSDVYNMDIEGIGINMRNELNLSISKSKLSTIDIEGIKQYLSQKPLTVQYELAKPITTIVESLTTPFAYENGHIILESGYEGQSLLPTLEYSTVVNKTGLVENVAKTIQRQEKQLTMLEKMLIQNIINLDYNNTLLTLKNEMEEML